MTQSHGGGSGCDLARIFSRLEGGIPTAEDRNYLFSRQSSPRLGRQIVTDGLLITKGWHGYGRDYRVDSLHIQSHKKTYRYLALLILTVVLSGRRRICLKINHPKSDVRQLILESNWGNHAASSPGVQFRPERFSYWPRAVEKHPWPRWESLGISVWNLPRFNLSNMKESSVTEEDWKNRDTVYGFGSDLAAVMFAELLLNIGRPQSQLNEVALEAEPGFRGVGPGSVEVSLHLPGGFGWFGDWWR